ncbi:MAG: DUF2953 domain-containing protein, partial [Lachnospiraceae bacterium]|nr:DUF2953 domain-containing protein [Lachnospiraceae bacterium]
YKDLLEDESVRNALSYTLKKVGRLLKYLLPRKIKGYVRFGTGDPATTGKILGAVSAVYAKTGPVFKLEPEFDKKIFECDIPFDLSRKKILQQSPDLL